MAGLIICYKAGRRAMKLADVRFAPHKGRRFLCTRCRQTAWDSLCEDLWALQGLKSQLDKTTKEKSTEICSVQRHIVGSGRA